MEVSNNVICIVEGNIKSSIRKNDSCKSSYSEKENEKRCSITLEDFTIGRSVSKLQCGHIFQSEAINKWLEIGHHECPLCRTNIHSNEFVTMASLLENIKKIRGFIVWFFDEMEALWDIRHG